MEITRLKILLNELKNLDKLNKGDNLKNFTSKMGKIDNIVKKLGYSTLADFKKKNKKFLNRVRKKYVKPNENETINLGALQDGERNDYILSFYEMLDNVLFSDEKKVFLSIIIKEFIKKKKSIFALCNERSFFNNMTQMIDANKENDFKIINKQICFSINYDFSLFYKILSVFIEGNEYIDQSFFEKYILKNENNKIEFSKKIIDMIVNGLLLEHKEVSDHEKTLNFIEELSKVKEHFKEEYKLEDDISHLLQIRKNVIMFSLSTEINRVVYILNDHDNVNFLKTEIGEVKERTNIDPYFLFLRTDDMDWNDNEYYFSKNKECRKGAIFYSEFINNQGLMVRKNCATIIQQLPDGNDYYNLINSLERKIIRVKK